MYHDMGTGNAQGRWPEKQRPRKSAQRCPRCGTMMETRVVMLECPGCKLSIPVAPARGRQSQQAPDSVVTRVKKSLALVFQQRYAEKDYTPTYFWKDWSHELTAIGIAGTIGCLILLQWSEITWEYGTAGLDSGYMVCWAAFLVNIPLQLAVLLHNSRVAKDMGVAWMLIMVVVSALFFSQVPETYPACTALGAGLKPPELHWIRQNFQAAYLGIPYFTWVGIYLLREKA